MKAMNHRMNIYKTSSWVKKVQHTWLNLVVNVRCTCVDKAVKKTKGELILRERKEKEFIGLQNFMKDTQIESLAEDS